MGEEDTTKKASGCGLLVLYNSVFRRRNSCHRHSTSTPSNGQSPKRLRPNSHDASVLAPIGVSDLPITAPQLTTRVFASNYPQGASRKPQHSAAASGNTGFELGRTNSISTELDNIIQDYQRTKGSSTLVRASSGNVMVFGNLGNIRAPGAVTPNYNVSKTAKEKTVNSNGKQNPGSTCAMGPVANSPDEEVEEPAALCRVLSRRLDPEELKEMGNEEYKNGRFAEAVALYDRAILIAPGKPSYWSNKAAALMSMGLLMDAVGECKEAVRIDPSYGRAHQRLATLYLRLGEAEKAIHHYKLARKEATSAEISQAKCLQTHLSKCHEARKLRDWHTVLKESQSAVSYGADSAPQVLAAQAEALLALRRHEEAETTLAGAPKFDFDASLKYFGASTFAYVLAVRAQVDMAAGRFEYAVGVAQRAAQIDPSSKEVTGVARKTRATAMARSTGNDLFKASKYREACMAYGEGLEHDPHNAILLCNRAACLSKLGQWDKAIEDCNAALIMRPSYTKARLRRADCNAKLERWERSVQDYEVLLQQAPGDKEIGKALLEAELKLKEQQGQDVKGAELDANLVLIDKENQFKELIKSSGLCVALLFDKTVAVSRHTIYMEKLCKHYPRVIFLKVNVDENPFEDERESSVPRIKIYKNGSRIREIFWSDHEQLEDFLRVSCN